MKGNNVLFYKKEALTLCANTSFALNKNFRKN